MTFSQWKNEIAYGKEPTGLKCPDIDVIDKYMFHIDVIKRESVRDLQFACSLNDTGSSAILMVTWADQHIYPVNYSSDVNIQLDPKYIISTTSLILTLDAEMS